MPAKKKKENNKTSTQTGDVYILTLKGTEKESSWTLFLDKVKGRYTGGFADGDEVKIEVPKKLAGKGKIYVGPGIRTRISRPSFLQDIEINSDMTVNVTFATTTSATDTKNPKNSSGKKLIDNKLQEKVQEKKAQTQEKPKEKNGAPKSDKKLLENKLKEQVEAKKKEGPKQSFWDRLK